MHDARAPQWALRLEPWFAVALCAIAFIWIPVSEGGTTLSWDALNHHIYLGWTAERPRFDRDFLAAGYQSLQYPYLYWPVYKLALSGASGITAGVVLAALHLPAVPAVWLISRRCMPGASWSDLAMRIMAVALAFMTGAVLSLMDMSSNDLMAAIPLIWSIALALDAVDPPLGRASIRVGGSGLLAGVAVAFKFSNGPIAVLLPLMWAFSAQQPRQRLRNVIVGCVLTVVGLVAAYGFWGALLWREFGNPMYPFYDGLFASVRALTGWSR
jgi:hypothetical protein